MSGIDELERMLESRSTDYGKMRQILAFYKLGIDKEIADAKRRAGIPKVPLVKIIENLVAGDKEKAVAYARHLIGTCEEKFKRTGDIFDKYDIMTARNILHTLKGEPKEGGIAVLDSMKGSNNERKLMDEVIAEEDKAVGLGVFSASSQSGGEHAPVRVYLEQIKDEAGIAKVKEIFFDIFPEERPRCDAAFDCYRESLQPDMWSGERLIYYLVHDEYGEIVGLTGIYSCIAHTAWLGWYGVVPSKRNRGYGHAILSATLDAMRSMGYKFARLYTEPDVNADAQHVYKSFGFVLDSVYEDGNKAIATMKLGLFKGGETPPDWQGRPYGY